MTLAVYFLIIFASVTQSATAKLFNRTSSNPVMFNAIKATASLVLVVVMSVFGFSYHTPTLIFGLSYGISLSISMYFGYMALSSGPMALTSMIVSFSVLIPVLYGVTVGKESLGIFQYFAFAFLVLAIMFTNFDKIRVKSERSVDYKKWLLFVFVTFLCNGACSVLQKQHQILYPEKYSKEFMLFAMILCSAVFLAFGLRGVSLNKIRKVKGKGYAVLSGIANGAANFLTLLLAGMENASVLFPIISGGTVFASLICGRFLFSEKLKLNHYFALAAGVAAVVLLRL